MNQLYDVIIIGAGACGLFTAINIAEKCPNRRILILEKGKEALSKVRISGGGRCNLTNGETDIRDSPPRQPRAIGRLFSLFQQRHHEVVRDSSGSPQGRR